MTAAMLVLNDLRSRSSTRAVCYLLGETPNKRCRVEALLFVPPEVVDADLADYFGIFRIPIAKIGNAPNC